VKIPQTVLEAALAALEPHAQHPGTGALHDPLYALLKGDDGDAVAEFALALVSQSGHPAAGTLREMLGSHVALPAPTLEAILRQYEPLAEGADPLVQADRMLWEAKEARRVLSTRVLGLETEVRSLSRTANAMAAAGAILAIFGAIGWLIAMGWLEIQWLDPAVPQNLDDAAAGRGQAAPAEKRSR